MAAPLLVALSLTFATRLPAHPEAEPTRHNLGLVDLVALAAAMPPDAGSPARVKDLPPPLTLSDLHRRVEAFLGRDVKRAVESARWRLVAAQRSAIVDTPAGSYEGNPWGALLAVVVGSVSYGMNPGLRSAKSCLTFLEGYERRVRALHEDVPETQAPITPELLGRWERLKAELGESGSCRGRPLR